MDNVRLGVIGLGYVGLPLAVEFGKVLPTVGFDINAKRIAELRDGVDHTLEVEPELLAKASQLSFESEIEAVEARNAEQKTTLFAKIRDHFGGELAGRTFALWGLAFKPNTDDMREAPSRVLMEALWDAGARVQAYDPEAMEETQRLYGHRDDLALCGTKEAALKGADALVIVTEWQSFRAPDFDLINNQLTQPVLFDGRNMFEPARMARKGFTYYSVGRLPQSQTLKLP